MKKVVQQCVSAASLVAVAAFSASAGIQFQRSVGFQQVEMTYCGENFSPSFGGGYGVVGRTAVSTTAPGDILAVRHNNLGNDIWTRVIGSANQANETAYSVRQTIDGGMIIGAETNSVSATMGIALLRLDPAGNTLWSNVYPGTPFLDSPSGVKVRVVRDGSFAAVGRIASAAAGLMSGVFLRVDPAGGLLVHQTYNVPGGQSQVSLTDLRVRYNAAGALSGFIVSGWYQPNANSQRMALIMQLDPTGGVLSSFVYPRPDESVTADGLMIAPNGNVFWTGRLSPTPTAPATETIAADINAASGAVVWARRIRDFRNGFAAVANDDDRFALVAGTRPSNGTASLYKFDPLGGIVFGMQYGTPVVAGQPARPSEGHDVVALECNKGYFVTGFTQQLPSNGPADEYIIKTNENGRSGCREDIAPPPIVLQQANTFLTLTATRRQEMQPWPTFNQPRDIGNIIYCISACVADVDDGSGTGTPDGGVTIEDLIYYLNLFDSGSPCADVDDGSGTGTPDGGVTIDDLIYFLFRFDLGC